VDGFNVYHALDDDPRIAHSVNHKPQHGKKVNETTDWVIELLSHKAES